MFKKMFTLPIVRFGTVLFVILGLTLAFPATRALADEILKLFRVQQVTAIPVDFTGLEQLTGDGALGNQFTDLISSSMKLTPEPDYPTAVTNAEEAGRLAGFNVRLPQGIPPSQIYVMDGAEFTITVDRQKAQALLDEAGRSDLVLPDAIDGAVISVTILPSVSVGYDACPAPHTGYLINAGISARQYPDCVILVEMPSPTVSAPAEVDVEQLALIGLEFTGMTPIEAAVFANTVDWTSTLVIPIPKGAAFYDLVTVDGVPGTLIRRSADAHAQYALLWVKDGIIHAISAVGTDYQKALDMANSLQ
ncbi:MAG: hypothetical protein ACOYYU_03285 [Chloroflexota bacterium]